MWFITRVQPYKSTRDYHDDLLTHVSAGDPTFHPCMSQMWLENSPQKSEDAIVASALEEAEGKIKNYEANRSDAAWNTDTLKLCHDASMCAKLLAAAVSNEKTKRLAKITHLKEQNSIGATVVANFAKKNCHHVPLACPSADQELAEDGNKIKPTHQIWDYHAPHQNESLLIQR